MGDGKGMNRLRDVPGHEGRYAITQDGRIWSYPKCGAIVRELRAAGHTQQFIADRFRVDRRVIYNVMNGITYTTRPT